MEQPITPQEVRDRNSLNVAIRALNWLIETNANNLYSDVRMTEWETMVQSRVGGWSWEDHYHTIMQMYQIAGWKITDYTDEDNSLRFCQN